MTVVAKAIVELLVRRNAHSSLVWFENWFQTDSKLIFVAFYRKLSVQPGAENIASFGTPRKGMLKLF
jgi:hypothetical protein